MLKNSGQKVLYLLFAGFIVVMDQFSKWFLTEVIYRPRLGGETSGLLAWYQNAPDRLEFLRIEVLPFYNLVMVWNEGVSFGMFSGIGEHGPLILLILSLVISFILLIWMLGSEDRAVGLALALVIGGAVGNMIDRARFGAVIDFIDLHVAGYHWPAFNIADSAIVIGIIFVIVHSLFFDKKSS